MWMACWLSLMLVLTIAGREGMRDFNVFQMMEVRSTLGLLLLTPLILAQGGFALVKTARLPSTPRATSFTTARSSAGSSR